MILWSFMLWSVVSKVIDTLDLSWSFLPFPPSNFTWTCNTSISSPPPTPSPTKPRTQRICDSAVHYTSCSAAGCVMLMHRHVAPSRWKQSTQEHNKIWEVNEVCTLWYVCSWNKGWRRLTSCHSWHVFGRKVRKDDLSSWLPSPLWSACNALFIPLHVDFSPAIRDSFSRMSSWHLLTSGRASRPIVQRRLSSAITCHAAGTILRPIEGEILWALVSSLYT